MSKPLFHRQMLPSSGCSTVVSLRQPQSLGGGLAPLTSFSPSAVMNQFFTENPVLLSLYKSFETPKLPLGGKISAKKYNYVQDSSVRLTQIWIFILCPIKAVSTTCKATSNVSVMYHQFPLESNPQSMLHSFKAMHSP